MVKDLLSLMLIRFIDRAYWNFITRQHASAQYCYGKSVRLSVRQTNGRIVTFLTSWYGHHSSFFEPQNRYKIPRGTLSAGRRHGVGKCCDKATRKVVEKLKIAEISPERKNRREEHWWYDVKDRCNEMLDCRQCSVSIEYRPGSTLGDVQLLI